MGLTTFTEIFCPDWRGNSLFLSHMGEVNPDLAAGRPVLCQKDFPYTPALPPAVLACALRGGAGVLANLAPGPAGRFALLAAPVEVLDEGPRSSLHDAIRGWIRPRGTVAEFLEEYSRLGGTHHSALVMGDATATLRAFAMFAGLEFHEL